MNNRKPTVAYLLGTFPSLTETFILREIKALISRGVSLHLFSLERPPVSVDAASPEVPQVQVEYAPGRWEGSVLREALKGVFARRHRSPRVEAAVHAWRRVLADHPEIVHLHGHFANEPSLVARALARDTGLPFSFSAHAWDIYCAGSPLQDLIAAAEFVATCTEMGQKYLLSQCKDADRSKVLLMRHGIEIDQFPYGERPPSRPFRFLAIGRLVAKKGFHLLIQALSQLRISGVPVQCDIVGDGPSRADLEQLCTRLNVKDSVRLCGSLPHSNTMELLRQADVLVVPSVITPEGDRDGLPNVILEAAAMGVPILASDLPGIAEFIEDQVSGLLVRSGDAAELADKMRALAMDDGTLLSSVRRGARKIVEERYDAVRNVEPLIELFNRSGRLSPHE